MNLTPSSIEQIKEAKDTYILLVSRLSVHYNTPMERVSQLLLAKGAIAVHALTDFAKDSASEEDFCNLLYTMDAKETQAVKRATELCNEAEAALRKAGEVHSIALKVLAKHVQRETEDSAT